MYHVIIIEDDPMVAAINRQYVEENPVFSVDQIFKDGTDALEYLKNHNADLVILDYYTPFLNGSQFLDRLHGMGMAPSVIMVTSANDAEIVRSLLSRGVLDYLVKPFVRQRFQTALGRFLDTRRVFEKNRQTMDQDTLDHLFGSRDPGTDSSGQITKGLNPSTLTMIRQFLEQHPGSLHTSEQIAEQTGLSRITIRRYMNYMVDTGDLFSVIDYKTGGRPSIKYGFAIHK